jgi:hypothetical protein
MVIRREARNMSDSRRKDLASVLGIVILAVLFMGESLLPDRMLAPLDLVMTFPPWSATDNAVETPYNWLSGDKVLYIQPIKTLVGQAWRNGIPLWEPHMLSGYPVIGNAQAGIFYPGTLPYVLLPGADASDLVALFHLIVAGLGMFVYLRTLRLRHLAAMLGAIVFMFNTGFIVWLMWDSVAGAMVWLPWALWAFEVALRPGRLWVIGLGAVAVALTYLGGHLQWSLYAMLILGFYSVYRLICPERASRRRVLGVAAVIGVLGTSLTAVQLWPTLEYIAAGHRGPFSASAFSTLLHWSGFLTLWAPQFFGSSHFPFDWWGPVNYNETIVYVGIVPLVLAFTAMIGRRSSIVVFWGIVAILGVLWASGSEAYRLLFGLPGFSSLGPYRMRYLIEVSLSALSAFGLDWLLGLHPTARKSAVRAIVISALIIASVYSIARLPVLPSDATRLDAVRTQELRFALWLSVSTAVLLIGVLWPRWGRYALAGVCVLALADLWPIGAAYQRPMSTQYYYPLTPDIVQMTQDNDLFRVMTTRKIGAWPFVPNLPSMYGLQDVGGYDSQYMQRYLNYIKEIDASAPAARGTMLLSPSHFDSPLIDLLNVKYAVTLDKIKLPGWGLISKEGMRVYMRTEVLPRAWIASQAEVIEDSRAIFSRLESAEFNPRQTVILEQPPDEPLGEASLTPAGTVSIESYANSRIALNAEMQRAGWLVLSEMFYPGWHATVDDVPANIYRANYLFRAIPLPPGSHQVELYFMPDSFVLGAAISLGTLLLLLAFGVLSWRIERHQPHEVKQEIQNENTH